MPWHLLSLRSLRNVAIYVGHLVGSDVATSTSAANRNDESRINAIKKMKNSKNKLSFSSIGTQVEGKHVLSRLWIGGASSSDTGNYTCTIPGHEADEFPRAKVKVHVVDGEFESSIFGCYKSLESSGINSQVHNWEIGIFSKNGVPNTRVGNHLEIYEEIAL